MIRQYDKYRRLECPPGEYNKIEEKVHAEPPAPMVLDACCGGRMFWFDKSDPRALFIDNREHEKDLLDNGQTFEVRPDMVMDFRKMAFPDKSFKLVIFDPPHLSRLGPKSWMRKKYGALDPKTWREDLRAGFSECFRVLDDYGVLVFKWNEHEIKVAEVLALTPHRPLVGHPSGKQSKTHWITFIKL